MFFSGRKSFFKKKLNLIIFKFNYSKLKYLNLTHLFPYFSKRQKKQKVAHESKFLFIYKKQNKQETKMTMANISTITHLYEERFHMCKRTISQLKDGTFRKENILDKVSLEWTINSIMREIIGNNTILLEKVNNGKRNIFDETVRLMEKNWPKYDDDDVVVVQKDIGVFKFILYCIKLAVTLCIV